MANSHILCLHPATKAGRAKCRAERNKFRAELRAELEAVIASYFTNVGSCEEIGAQLSRLSASTRSESLRAAALGYYEEDLDMEEIIALATKAVHEI